MKKIFLLIHLMLCAALMCACGSENQEMELDKDSKEGQEEIDLTLWTFPVGDWGNPTSVSNLLTGFRKEYPNHTLMRRPTHGLRRDLSTQFRL